MIPQCEQCGTQLVEGFLTLSGLSGPNIIITEYRTAVHFCNKFCFWEWTTKMMPDEHNLYKTKLRVLREQINNLIHDES